MASPSTTTHQVTSNCMSNWNPISKAQAVATGRSTNDDYLGTPANYSGILSLDARLIAINSTVYTQARLNTMSVNDKCYAIALTDDPGFVR
jgi:hypothetical protein